MSKMNTKICFLLFALFSLILVGCADLDDSHEAIIRRAERIYGKPYAQWTNREKWAEAVAEYNYRQQRLADLASRPVYVPAPYIASGGVSPELMLNAPQFGHDYGSYPSYSGYRTPSMPTTTVAPLGALNANRYDPNSLANPYGAGSPYKANGLMNPYSQYGSPYTNKSWRNPYATDAPKLYDSQGKYHGRLSTNPYDADSTSNPYGRYGSKYSPDSINNPYGAGNPYSTRPIYVTP